MPLACLHYHANRSDRQVVAQAQSNRAFRWVLGLSLDSPVPHPTLLTSFRQRLGWAKQPASLDALVGQAREQGVVKDRLRLQDAPHLLANSAISSASGLVSQTRPRLLHAVPPWDADDVARQEQQVLAVRTATADRGQDERLLPRVAPVRARVTRADAVAA